ncbi:MAG: hypothetical protein WCB86_10035 [Candidatus Dormiibacterota bacterium]
MNRHVDVLTSHRLNFDGLRVGTTPIHDGLRVGIRHDAEQIAA